MNNITTNIDTFLDDVVRIPGKPAWLVFCGYAIGETATFCALAGEFKKQHGHEIVIIITPKHQQVVDMFAHQFIKVVVISDDAMRMILGSGYIPQDRFQLDQAFSPCWIDRGFRYSDGIRFLSKYPGRGGISDMDLARMVLHLPWNSKLEAPVISENIERNAFDFALQNGLRIGRSVLLCPINNSAPKFPLFFWNKLAKFLLEKGFAVFTNMGGLNQFNGLSSMPIEGTIPIDLSIQYFIPFIRLAGQVISGGNGINYLQMMADNKKYDIINLVPYSKNAVEGHSSLGFQSPTHPEVGNANVSAYQYAAPELCLNTRLYEYLLPYDGDEFEMAKYAYLVANKDIDDGACIRRVGEGGKPYVEEYHRWLVNLRACEN